MSSWRLNAAEKVILAERVAAGKSEAVVKRELQLKKAEANEERKQAAQAVAQKAQKQAQKGRAKAKAKAGPKAAAAAPPALGDDNELNDNANRGYYLQVQADIATILAEFGADFRTQKPLKISGGAALSGVQAPFEREKAREALEAHGTYRCSISVWWVNSLQSPTPGVPMSRKRVLDLAEFSFGSDGTPRFHSDRMIEVAVSKSDVDTEQPSNLQMISPEELVHATFAGCVRAIENLGSLGLLCCPPAR